MGTQARRKSRAKSCQGSVTRPEEATPPFFPLLHSRPQRRVTTKANVSRLVPHCPSPSSHYLQFPQQRLWPRPTSGCLLELSTLIPSPRPELELQKECPPMAQGLESGTGNLRGEKRTHLMQTKGEQFLHALSAILEGRHRAPLRFFLFSLRRHHIRPGHSTETQEALGLWRSEPGEDRPVWSGNSTPQHTRAPGETANVMNTGLKAFSQRRACLPHSEHCGRPSASLRRPAVGLHLSEALFPGARVCTACWGL